MARIIIKLSLGVAAACAGLLVAVPALAGVAYVVGGASSCTAPAVEPGGAPFTMTCSFVQPSGAPFPAGVAVTFSETSGPTASASTGPATADLSTGTSSVHLVAAVQTTCQATFNPVTTATNSSGAVRTTVVLPPGCPGPYVLTATAAGSGSVSVTVTESSAASAQAGSSASNQAGAFPNTTALPPGTSGPAWVGPALISGGSAAILIALVALMVWRQRRSRREA